MGDHFRKVKFSGSSKIGKKKKKIAKLMIKLNLNDDEDMGISLPQRQVQKNNDHKRDRRENKNRQGPPIFKQQALRPSNWYQIRLPQCAQYEKQSILRLILRYISPHVFVPVSYGSLGNDAVFYVDDVKTARLLASTSRKILRDDGHLMAINVRDGIPPPPTPINAELKEKLKVVMVKRYIAENKALDLSKFVKDPEFVDNYYCPLSRPPVLAAVMQIISENIVDIIAINLNSNRIQTFDAATCSEFKKLKNLRILHLEDNQIKSLSVFNHMKGLEVTEVRLTKNPVCSNFSDQTHYISEIRKRFPKVVKLDDLDLPPVISFEVADEGKLPPSQAAFMCSDEGKSIVRAFLSQYFEIYDSGNRQNLEQAYHQNSFFSQTAYYPPNQSYDIEENRKLDSYIQDSRNLYRVSDFHKRKTKLHGGKENIVKYLNRLPKTQHDLSSFLVDLTFFTPALINLTVSGIFREPNASSIEATWPVRYFSRTFLIVPVGQGFCIVNDLLSITNASPAQIAISFKKEVVLQPRLETSVVQAAGPPALPQINEVVGAVAQAVASLSVAPVQPPIIDDAVRLQMVQTLSTRTGMNLDWSKKCLDETQWDFDRALWAFTELQKQGTIPAEAFIK